MIRFSLSCDNGHEFEGWFSSNDDFDAQVERKLVQCPHCNSALVTKTLMAPALAKSGKARSTGPAGQPVALAMSDDQKAAVKKLQGLVREIKANADDVGERFPEEARKIHYGESEARGIFGRASLDEAKSLVEEGIGIAPLPDVSDEFN